MNDPTPAPVRNNGVPLTLANRITIVRILFIPLFILLALYYCNGVARGENNVSLRWMATSVFLLVFLLDAIDGYVARTRKEVTKLGTVLDPLADKAMLLSALILLGKSHPAFNPGLPQWFVLLVISRDALLIGGGLIIQSIVGHVTVRPRISGKATTFFQMTVIIWVLIGFPAAIKFHATGMPCNALRVLIVIAATLTSLSAIQYIMDGVRQLEKAK